MATTCELTAVFQEPPELLYEQLKANIHTAMKWGTHWDMIREEAFVLESGIPIQQIWGFSAAYARVDGMGGHVNFWVRIAADGTQTEVNVVVSSPYEGRGGKHSAYYRRAHHVALRLLEFCVAPYEDIHPRLGTLKRILDSLRPSPTQRATS